MSVRKAFIIQAEACENLGSPFTGGLCRLFAAHLDTSTEVGRLCLEWKGDPGPSADSIPLRLCGGLHALVLSGRDEELAKSYPPHSVDLPSWDLIASALVKQEDFLLDWMKSPPQTNEVSRAAVIWPAFMAVARQVNMPLRLLEVGASAGLNLQAQRFAYQLGNVECGEAGSALRLEPDWQGQDPAHCQPEIVLANGCDINPLDPTSHADALRLRAYVWPDQAARHQRLNAALDIARANPIAVEKADAVDWLEHKLAEPADSVCTVIYSTIAWQYLPKAARAAGDAVITEAAARASREAPLAWVRFEADGEKPGAGIRLQTWPNGFDANLGRADFHGRWIDWQGI